MSQDLLLFWRIWRPSLFLLSLQVCHFDRLSDHLAVAIFKNLDKEVMVFLLPQVCKRWSTLVKAEDLWKDCQLFFDPFMSKKNKTLFFKILNMAPILDAVTIELGYRDVPEFSQQWKRFNPQEISAMEFIYDNMPPSIMFEMLKKYKDCVTKLIISDTYTPYVESDVKKLWSHIQNLSKLKHLTIDGAGLLEYKATLRKDAPCWKSLQVLDVKDSSYEDMNTVQRLVSLNPNWTEVYLGSSHPEDFRGEVKALSKCVNLDTIQVPFCKELKLFENCGKLDSLIIDCVEDTAKEIKGIVSAMNKSTYFPLLTKLKMIGVENDYVTLLKCLVKNHPQIIHLNLVNCEMKPEDVANVLGCLENLEKLYLHEMDHKTTIAIANYITTGNLPQLQALSVSECYCDNIEFCAKEALARVQAYHQVVRVDTECINCSCKPVDATSTKQAKKRKHADSGSTESQKISKPSNDN